MRDMKEAIERVQFRTRGKWYLAQQVDSFLEELSVRVDQESRERDSLEREAGTLREEKAHLEVELREAVSRLVQQEAPPQKPPQPSAQELEQERDGLIQDIKALRQFRDSLCRQVAQEAQTLLRQVEELSSQKLV